MTTTTTSSQLLTKIADCIPDDGIDFEYCSVKHTETKVLTLTNPGTSIVNFDVKMDDYQSLQDFNIQPRSGKYFYFHIINRANKSVY